MKHTDKKRAYSVKVDGNEIDTITLSFHQYRSQAARDTVKKQIAEMHGIGTAGMKLHPIVNIEHYNKEKVSP